MERQIARSRAARLRKKIEMLFAHLKRILKLGYEAQTVRVMSSFSQPPPRTFARWQS
jgi:hypothetical protein